MVASGLGTVVGLPRAHDLLIIGVVINGEGVSANEDPLPKTDLALSI
jgi:hypothetical protein